jgi:IS605 OrfB family transposase
VKITRSSKCSLKFATAKKQQLLHDILQEYGRVVNIFIDRWWLHGCPKKMELTADKVQVDTRLSARLVKQAAREAVDMIMAVRERHATAKKNKEKCKTTPKKPVHRGKRMCVSADIAKWQGSNVMGFDAWLHIQSIGDRIIFDIPIKFHKHYNELAAIGKRNEFFIITKDYVQVSFEIEVNAKLPKDRCIAVDSGINALASVSTGEQYGKEVKQAIERIRRCKHGSKGQKRANRSLRHLIDFVAKKVVTINNPTLIVVEQLKNITKNSRGRGLNKTTRYLLSRWNVRYWLSRLEQQCERNRVSFRTVPAYYTSQRCSVCGHTEQGNRNGEIFCCLNCGYQDNADVQASRNILQRFLTGKYSSGCKELILGSVNRSP